MPDLKDLYAVSGGGSAAEVLNNQAAMSDRRPSLGTRSWNARLTFGGASQLPRCTMFVRVR